MVFPKQFIRYVLIPEPIVLLSFLVRRPLSQSSLDGSVNSVDDTMIPVGTTEVLDRTYSRSGRRSTQPVMPADRAEAEGLAGDGESLTAHSSIADR